MSAIAERVISRVANCKVTQKRWLTCLCLVASDCIAVSLAVVASLLVFRFWHQQPELLTTQLLPTLLLVSVFAALGLYPVVGLSPVKEFQKILLATTLGYGTVCLISFLRVNAEPALFTAFVFAWAATVLLIMVCRAILRSTFSDSSWWGTPTIIFASDDSARMILQTLKTHPALGLKVVGIFSTESPQISSLDEDGIYVGPPHSAAMFAERCGIFHAIIATSDTDGQTIDKIIKTHARTFKSLLVIPEIPQVSSVWVEPRDFGGMLGLHVHQNLMDPRARMLKRALDIALPAFLATLLLPVLAIIFAAIRLSSRGPVFYGQTRIGRNNSTFTAWKFRSMFANADEVLLSQLEKNPKLRSEWERDHKLKNDPRITSVGRLLRKTSLDELPQLWNVFRGDMSLVGPRPIVAAEIARYSDVFEAYKSVRPGITGMWQVSGRNNTTYLERIRFDEYYVRNWSVWLDLYILVRTFKTVLFGEGAY
jgi:Undecaprenyl-phosphate galactose phosphotransferase WbaP